MINSKSKLASVQNAGPPCLLLALAPLVLNPSIRENSNDPLNSRTELAECVPRSVSETLDLILCGERRR